MDIRSEVVRGNALPVPGRRLVPVVRRVTGYRRRASIGSTVSAWGGGLARITPIGLVEEWDGGERFIPIHDRTTQLLGALLLAAVVVPLLLLLATHVARE